MGWLDKLFGKDDRSTTTTAPEAAPTSAFAGLEGIRFGRYSDNNKSYSKTQSWYKAEDRFKEKDYAASFAALFDYIADEQEGNVVFKQEGERFQFELIQGSKKVYGECDGSHIVARAPIATMLQPSNAVMRRLLETNFSLYYSRCALDPDNKLCMVFDTPVRMASPNKMYYAMREMAKFADRQDEILVADFTSLQAVNDSHIQAIPEPEVAVKYQYFRKWIEETIQRTSELNADSFSGAIAYAFLTLLYRIDFLIVPEAGLMAELEKVSNFYWNKKEETAIVERNAMLREGIRKLLDISLDDFRKGIYRSKATFAITAVPSMDKVKENVQAANKDAMWYVDNKYPDLALVINEYGMVYNQFTYSMPAVITELTTIYMAVMHADFFKALGMKAEFYNPETKQLDKTAITTAIDQAIARWTEKFTSLKWDHNRINYSSRWEFGTSFSEHVVGLNMEVKR